VVALSAPLAPGYPVLGRVGDLELTVCPVAEAVYVTGAICSHAYALLPDGALDGFELECPFHGGRFDVRTGAATALPCVEPIPSYPAKRVNGDVYVRLE
jgi:nitrite reductase/ring-hydroxylating ferredoxin subunit